MVNDLGISSTWNLPAPWNDIEFCPPFCEIVRIGSIHDQSRKWVIVDNGQNCGDCCEDDDERPQNSKTHISIPRLSSWFPECIDDEGRCQKELHVIGHIPEISSCNYLLYLCFCGFVTRYTSSPSLPNTSHPLFVYPVKIVDVKQICPPFSLAILHLHRYQVTLEWEFDQLREVSIPVTWTPVAKNLTRVACRPITIAYNPVSLGRITIGIKSMFQ